jgi:hypothetical protein
MLRVINHAAASCIFPIQVQAVSGVARATEAVDVESSLGGWAGAGGECEGIGVGGFDAGFC